MMTKLLHWFYGTYIGGLYLQFQLWLDEQNGYEVMSSKEVQQIVMQAQQMQYREGASNEETYT